MRKQDKLTVLNTDKFDRRRFKQIYNMSKGLQDLNRNNQMPLFYSLLADTWASLYKMNPVLNEDVASELSANKSLMERIMTEESFQDFREFTKLDDLSSAIGTVKFGEKTNEWLEEEQQMNEQLRKQLEQIQQLQKDIKDREKRNKKDSSEGAGQQREQDKGSPSGKQDNLQEQLQKAMQQLGEEIQQSLEQNPQQFSKKISQAMSESKETKEDLKSLLEGINAGSGEAELQRTPLRDQITLAEKVASNKQLKEIANWTGRFKQIARKKQKSKHDKSIERSGVTLGNQIEALLPSDLALYTSSTTKHDFLRRFAESNLLQYEQLGKEELGKGPIILCLDQSGSMDHLDTQSKGFTLALMSIARRQRRDFCLILFSTKTKIFKYERGKITTRDMVRLAETFLGGGTRFDKPLEEALSVIGESRFKKADVVFITDGEAYLRTSFIENFNKTKKEKEFNVLTLLIEPDIRDEEETIRSFSDKVIEIQNFNEEGGFQAFSI